MKIGSGFLLMIILTVTFALSACNNETEEQNKQQTWEEVQLSGDGTVTLVYVPSEGFSYENEEGRLTGVTIELFRDFISWVNEEYAVELEAEMRAIESFSDFYGTVRDGSDGLFGVANVTITEDRRQELQFSPSYMTNIATLITHSERDEIGSMDDVASEFVGLDALAFEGTLHEVRLQQIVDNHLPEAEIAFAHSNNEIIERVAESDSYFAYVDIYNYWRASQEGAPLLRHAAGDEASEQFGVIMPLNSDWGPLMREFFEHDGGYLQSERYRYLMETHLGSELADLLLDPELTD